MILDIANINKLVKVNGLKPITTSLTFDKDGTPDPNGLFSYEIFGYPGSKERKLRFAYIDLNGHYLHPQVYKILLSLDKKISKIITGEAYFKYNESRKYFEEVSEEDPGADTGLDFLYKYWNSIVWRDTGSRKRSDKLILLSKLDRDEAFMTKQIVIPPFLRDMNFSDMSQSVINTYYKKIINSVDAMKSLGGLGFGQNHTKFTIQSNICMIQDECLRLIKLKRGFIHQSLMSKNIDYGVRTIITAPSYNANKWSDNPVDFEHASVPLSQCISSFIVAIEAYINAWINATIMDKNVITTVDMTTRKVTSIELDPKWKVDFNARAIHKRAELFISTPESRFMPVTIRCADKKYRPFYFLTKNSDIVLNTGEVNVDEILKCRYLTWTDLFYIAAKDVCADKHVLITRYPVTGYMSEYFAKISVRSTFKTVPMLINGEYYKEYPLIDVATPKNKIESLFIDSLELFPSYIAGLGADYDGDQITLRGLYTYEANKYAEDFIKSKANMVNTRGSSAIKEVGDSGDHSLGNLLRDPEE